MSTVQQNAGKASQLRAQMRTALSRGDARNALALAHRLLSAEPGARDAHALIGQAAAHFGDAMSAVWHLDQAISDDGETSPGLIAAKGIALARAGSFQESIPFLERTIAFSEAPSPTLLQLAWVYERLGQFEEMRGVLQQARQHSGGSIDIDVREAILIERTGEWQQGLTTLDKAEKLSGEDRLARGRMRERSGRYSEAWEDFLGGKQDIARTQKISYPAAGIAAHFEQLKQFFTAERFAEMPCATHAYETSPIFVSGAPRSGTTLAERLIASDADTVSLGELPFASELIQQAAQTLGSYPAGIGKLQNAALQRFVDGIGQGYLDRAQTVAIAAIDSAQFIDKMPFNEQHLPMLSRAFPAAPFIVMTRHPLDVVVSMMSHQMTHGYHCALSPASAAQHIAAIDGLVAHWESIGCRFDRLRYEDLASNPSQGVATLGAIVGRNLTDAPGAAAIAATPSYASVQQPIHDKAIGRWRNYEAQLLEIMPVAKVLAKRHGYRLD